MNSPFSAVSSTALEQEIGRNVAAALAEDVGSGDLTAQLVPADVVNHATVISRETAVLCGTAWFDRCFKTLDPSVSIIWRATVACLLICFVDFLLKWSPSWHKIY